MFRSLHMKLVMIMLLLVTSLMAVVTPRLPTWLWLLLAMSTS